MKSGPWRIVGIGLMAFGAILVFGLITIFPSSTTCVGLFLFGQCLGYYSTTYNGNNFILGLVLIGVGALVYLLRGRKGR